VGLLFVFVSLFTHGCFELGVLNSQHGITQLGGKVTFAGLVSPLFLGTFGKTKGFS